MNGIEMNDTLQSQWENVLERDKIFTKLLSDFAKHQANRDIEQQKQKKIFFWMVCISFFIVIVGCIVALIIIALIDDKSWEDFGVAIGSVVSLISVIIVLPSKIAEHLFPANGEKDITEFFAKAHEADLRISVENAASDIAGDDDKEYESLRDILNAYDEVETD